MLHCVYHPVEQMRVVDDAERVKLLASGVWFDSPDEAKAKRKEAEANIAKKDKQAKQTKRKEKRDEKGQLQED